MSELITIPSCSSPFIVDVNGETYSYPAGETVEVPDHVAAVITHHMDMQPKPEPNGGTGGGSGGEYGAMLSGIIDGTATHVAIPNGCKAIRVSCFGGCNNLESVNIPDSVESIGASAFNKLPSLKSIVIPDGVTSVAPSSIGSGIFTSCTSMESATIGKNVSALVGGAFMGCSALKSVTFRGKTTISPNQGVYPFNSCTGLTDIYVPWAEGEVAGAPWDATNATIHYNHTEG